MRPLIFAFVAGVCGTNSVVMLSSRDVPFGMSGEDASFLLFVSLIGFACFAISALTDHFCKGETRDARMIRLMSEAGKRRIS